MRPFSFLTVSKSRSRSARLPESPCTPATVFPISLTALSNYSFRRPVMKTWAPSSTNSLALARAMPDVPPVTTATLFCSFPMLIFLFSNNFGLNKLHHSFPHAPPASSARCAAAISSSVETVDDGQC
jgi:hypothetical protein